MNIRAKPYIIIIPDCDLRIDRSFVLLLLLLPCLVRVLLNLMSGRGL